MTSDTPTGPSTGDPRNAGGSPANAMPPRSSALARWGPTLAIVALLAGGTVWTATSRPPASTAPAASSAPGESAGNPDLPPLYNDPSLTGKEVDWGPTCDVKTGDVKMPAIGRLPCVPAWKKGADNGGATSLGVTADTITLVRYVPPANGDLTAALQGLQDTEEDSAATAGNYVTMLTDIYETYGRTVKLVNFTGSGNSDDATAARADAVKIAEEYQPFAVLGGPALTAAFMEELAARKVLCIVCTQAMPDSVYQQNAPYLWGLQPTPEQFLLILGDYITNRLNGRPAKWAGEGLTGRSRVFGVVRFELDPPVFGAIEEEAARRGRERGYETKVSEKYTLDLPKLPERADSIISKMKGAGVTTVIFLGDPLMPQYLTQAATRQNYFPEWIVTGTVLTDTTAFGRLYDQKQWRHAFGLSNLPVRTPRELRDSWKLHEWYFGSPPPAQTTNAIIYPQFQLVMAGIHLAGPNLTPETFRDGLFRLPPNPSSPLVPQVSFGEHGAFPEPDYLGSDDMTEIWWDADSPGVDERGADGKGVYRYVAGGKRYLAGSMPTTEPRAFDPEGTVTDIETLPPDDAPPEYPAPDKGAGNP